MAKKLPKEMLIYAADYLDDGTPVYTAVSSIEDIPEDAAGEMVGNYVLNNTAKFGVKKILT